jgi:hypothetical protein
MLFDKVAPGQTCARCQRPFEGNHELTPLGAVRCLHLPADAGLAPWTHHRLNAAGGSSYLSLVEQVGWISAILEVEGLPAARRPVMRHVHELVRRIEARCPAPPHRFSGEDMPQLLKTPYPEVPLGIYAHYKGGRYCVVGGSLRATGYDEEVMIVYVPMKPVDGIYYQAHRTLWDWQEEVDVPGDPPRRAPRFRLVVALDAQSVFEHLTLAISANLRRAVLDEGIDPA